MPGKKHFQDPVDHARHIAYWRWLSQARYRGEPTDLTLEQWFKVWTPELWARRGRGVDDLCLIRGPKSNEWRLGNLAIVSRRTQLTISNRQTYKIPVDDLYKKTVWRDYD
jgi:hypothetical protein